MKRLLIDIQQHGSSDRNRIKRAVLGECFGRNGEGIERRPQPESAFDEIGIPIHIPTLHPTQPLFQLKFQIPIFPLSLFFIFIYFLFFSPPKKNGKCLEMVKYGNRWGRADQRWVQTTKAGRTPVWFNSTQPFHGFTRRHDVVFCFSYVCVTSAKFFFIIPILN